MQRMPVPCTIIASIVEKGDENFIKDIMRQEVRDRDDIKLVIVRARGTGKRDGLAHAFRALSRQMPLENAVVGVVDGELRPLLPDHLTLFTQGARDHLHLRSQGYVPGDRRPGSERLVVGVGMDEQQPRGLHGHQLARTQ